MICPKCKELGQKSTITVGAGMVTCAYYPPYYDEEGVYHHHDGNNHTYSYTCSNNHRMVVTSSGKCPNCDWGHGSEKITVEDIKTQVLNLNGIGTLILK